jgi:hypothetical protein
MIQEYIGARTKHVYSRTEWETLGNDGQYRIGYSDGYSCCEKSGLSACKYLIKIKSVNSYERGKQQAAIDWLSDPKIKICGNCGHAGEDVNNHLAWIGGQGYTPVIDCDDLTACWNRWDQKHK